MFTHADFNRSGRPIGRAFVSHRGYWTRVATIWQFECGDIAFWVRATFIAWPHSARIQKMLWPALGQLFDLAQLGELGTRIDGR